MRRFTSVQLGAAAFAALSLSACASSRSADLLTSAKNYKARSLEALDKLGAGVEREGELPRIADGDAEKKFVDEVLASGSPTSEAWLLAALRPGAVSVPAKGLVADNIGDMRKLHAEFALAFENVDRAGLLGKRPIAVCAPPVIDRMVARQLFLAKALGGAGPLRLQARRGLLLAQIDQARRAQLADGAKRERITDLRRAWLALEAEEEALNAEVIASLALAAQTGLLLRKQTMNYGKISIDEVKLLGGNLLSIADGATSRDLSLLRGKVDGIFIAIEADSDFKDAADIILDLSQQKAVPESALAQCLARQKGK